MGDGVMVDLFGDPVPLNRGRKGRPEHVPTAENRTFVTVMLAVGEKPEAIAAAVVPGGISMPTLRKHYFSELAGRKSARLRVKGKLLAKWIEQAMDGNVGAGKLIAAELARADMGPAPDQAKAVTVPREPALGKKEQEQREAYGAGRGTSWEEALENPVRH